MNVSHLPVFANPIGILAVFDLQALSPMGVPSRLFECQGLSLFMTVPIPITSMGLIKSRLHPESNSA